MTATVPPPAEDAKLKFLVLHLTLGRYLVLKKLSDEPQSMTDLSKIAGVSTAGMTGTKDTLQREGLITDYRDSEDRRKVLVSLTKKGEQVLAMFEKSFADANAD